MENGKRRKLLSATFVLAIIAIILALVLVITLSPEIANKIKAKKVVNATNESNETAVSLAEFMAKLPAPIAGATQTKMYLPAVDNQGNGTMTLLVVEAMPGTGRTLTDIDNLIFWADTQHSIRIARNVAANISGVNVSNYDLIYSIYANASVIGGESAGAAITIATIAALLNKTLPENVSITGTINHDGTIGPVEGILPKAKAAKGLNTTTFLVPLLQSNEVIYEERQHCEKYGPAEVCTTEKVPRRVNITEEAGINIVEVETIQEAMKYFFKE